jgi:hypothetical protein
MSKNDDKIKALLIDIDKKKKEMGEKPRASWKTNGILRVSGDEANINTVNSTDRLVELTAKLLSEKANYSEACQFLGLQEKTSSKVSLINDTLEDVKLRTQMVLWDIEKKKLDVMERKLKDLRSEDAKTEDALADIAKELM